MAILAVCFFVLGALVYHCALWFYNNYITQNDDQFIECDDCQ